MADDDLVTLARFGTLIEAHEARIELEGYGIDSLIANDSSLDVALAGLSPILPCGIVLLVKEADRADAVAALRDTPAAKDLEAGDEPS